MRINSVPDANVFVIIRMCYVHNQWYDISCATLCVNGYELIGGSYRLYELLRRLRQASPKSWHEYTSLHGRVV